MCKLAPVSSIPDRLGTYVLVMRLRQPTQVRIGRLGLHRCLEGWYAYAGSALGPGGLAARLGRHRQSDKRFHWHIDYLLAVSELVEIRWAASSERWECRWARALSRGPVATVPIPGFGASDCGCAAHLIHFPDRPLAPDLDAALDGFPGLRRTVLELEEKNRP